MLLPHSLSYITPVLTHPLITPLLITPPSIFHLLPSTFPFPDTPFFYIRCLVLPAVLGIVVFMFQLYYGSLDQLACLPFSVAIQVGCYWTRAISYYCNIVLYILRLDRSSYSHLYLSLSPPPPPPLSFHPSPIHESSSPSPSYITSCGPV